VAEAAAITAAPPEQAAASSAAAESAAAPLALPPGGRPPGRQDSADPIEVDRAPAVRTVDARLSRQPPRRVVLPTRLALPSLDVRATVEEVGLRRDGEVAVPADVDRIGWYRYAAAPGALRGATVLVGHVDAAGQGPGIFARLRDLRRGDPVQLELADERRLQYRVVAREQWSKSSAPLGRLFARSGAPRLVLLTCGGEFDRGRYADNVAVTAVPVGGEAGR